MALVRGRAHPECRVRGCSEDARDCTTRQRNTHNTESREVRYPWHPWFGRVVTVYETVSKSGQPVCRCGIEDQRNDRSVEVPAWMFAAATCTHRRLTTTAVVGPQALIGLKAMFP